jgi:hypothetical protein
MMAGNASRGGGTPLARAAAIRFPSSSVITHTVPWRGPVTFFAPPKKVTKERGIPGSPPLPRFLVRYPCAARPARRSAQLAHRLDSCRFLRRELLTFHSSFTRLAQCSPEFPGRSALLGGEQGPQTASSAHRPLRRIAFLSLNNPKREFLSRYACESYNHLEE